ncbi:AAEL006252-PA [Aedes aegypti]|uniref:AAEL006252-PA n=1 Tax=Aedes aegypti TaxID=7159 RepID=Q176U8_AEDAE|nr:AAEL006252-PA [Aedes aegypti]
MDASVQCVAFRFTLLLLIMQFVGAGRQVYGLSYHQPVASAITTGEVNCNDLFTVDRENSYRKQYEGTLQLKSDVTLRDVEIDLRFDRQVDLLVNYFGVAGSVNNRDFRITKSGYKQFAHTLLKIKLEVSYSTSSPPQLEEIRLNGVVICPVKFVSRSDISTEPTTPVYRYPPNSWSLNTNPVPLVRPSAIGNVPSFQPIQQPAAVPRNFTDERENRFNSTCAAMGQNIIITPGRWDGELTVNTDVAVDDVQIEIVFDRPVYVLGVSE